MKTLPFIIQKIVFRDEPAIQSASNTFKDDHPAQLVNIEDCSKTQASIPGYFVMSSAPPNIDEKSDEPDISAQRLNIQNENRNAVLGIKEIAQHLYDIVETQERNPELVITVHGYNTSRSSVQNWYKDIFLYINRYDSAIASQRNQIFVGYRWPSENVELGRLGEAIAALPPLPRDILIGGLICGLAILILQFTAFAETVAGFLLTLVLAAFLLLGFIMLALVLMRLVVYFRDRYRANNFGVLDLVELLRQLDREMIRLKILDIKHHNPDCNDELATSQANAFWKDAHRKIKLSFLGHSMGGFVVTNVVRILSDVFDAQSIDKQPTSDIGSVFQLERLLLASPDIPVLTIISSRSNFLASSLRRFAESYLFSSEGDIALRIASTAANYIAFPSRTQSRGYRLGNVSLTQPKKTRRKNHDTGGIVNLATLDHEFYPGRSIAEAIANSPDKILEHLFVTSKRSSKKADESLAELFREQTNLSDNRVTVADFFTFFDCTDYKDVKFSVKSNTRTDHPIGLLTRAKKAYRLNSVDYLMLTLDYASGKRDVHGGYFQGDFSQQMIYRTLFLGFTGYLQTIDPDPTMAFDPHVALSKLDAKCKDMSIQGFLSPIRYRVDIDGQSLAEMTTDLLTAIKEEPIDETVD
ncbi:MAG: alpha/beta hydrolase [Cyanobacteria bacterium P01_A01_bin.37]